MRRSLLLFAALGVVGAVSCSLIADRETTPPIRPDGLVAYSFEGDIWVGDIATGITNSIVEGPDFDINPKFSPDGSLIAFVRGTPVRGPAALLVVKPDGSDLRVVVPEGFSGATGGTHGPGPFAWTPDGSSIVVEIDSPPLHGPPHHDGELTMFKVDGSGGPTLLVPPLNAQIGAVYFNPSAGVAPMFEPLSGDLIANPRGGAIEMYDAGLTLVHTIEVASKTQVDPFSVSWSPDASMIIVSGLRRDSSGGASSYEEVVVVEASTGEPQAYLGPARGAVWAPDGSTIAYETWSTDDLPTEARIAIYDLDTGEVRVLKASVSGLKRGAKVQTVTNNVDHAWYFEGWTWSPDGRFLILLKDHLTRPVVVDVEADTSFELDWVTDSFPSWSGVPE